MDEREPRLVADRVIAPDFGDVHVVFRRQPARDVDRSGRHVEMKRRAGPAQVGPLGHGFEVIDRLGRFDLDGPHQLVAPVGRRQDEIGKDLHLSDPHRHRLVLADVGDDVVAALEPDLQQPDDTVVLELLADRTHQNRTHETSRRRISLNEA